MSMDNNYIENENLIENIKHEQTINLAQASNYVK